MLQNHRLYFTAPYQIAVKSARVPQPQPHELLVQTVCSAISAGTELLLYRGLMPQEMFADETIGALQTEPGYPLPYGYAAVGQVVEVGAATPRHWQDQLVFGFQPHASFWTARPHQVLPVPAGMAAETAVFLPNMETAVSLVMDGRPVIGEQVALFGQGIIGLLTTSLLALYPVATLVTVDKFPLRRQWSERVGATNVFDPTAANAQTKIVKALQQKRPVSGADLTFELSGNPSALNQAIQVTGDHGRIIIGSWYGTKEAALQLGGRFHRSHIKLLSSQVSQISPPWQGRWTKARRLKTAWQMLATVRPEKFITQRVPIQQAANAFQMLDKDAAQTLQVLLTYA